MKVFTSSGWARRLLLFNVMVTTIAPSQVSEGKNIHEPPHFLPHDSGRRSVNLLPKGRTKRCTNASPVARTSVVVADV